MVDVEAAFTAAGGAQQRAPGFYYQGYSRSGDITKETLTPNGSPVWKVRYAPSRLGYYAYSVTITDAAGTRQLGSGAFIAVPSDNPGYVRAAGLHFQFDNGQPFIPMGVNAPWFQYRTNGNQGTTGDGTYGSDVLFAQLRSYGANALHLWTCEWNYGKPQAFAKPSIDCDGTSNDTLTQMRQTDSWDMDYIVQHAQAQRLYLMPVLKQRDQKAVTPGDYIYMRYAVARWGYATSIMAWDTFKEGGTRPTVVATYASALEAIDPYHHPVTASQFNHYGTSNPSVFNQVFTQPSMALVQNHDYSNECNLPYQNDTGLYIMHLSFNAPMDLRRFGKPYFFGETGVHPCASDGVSDIFGKRSTYYRKDTQGRITRGDIWGELMATSGAFADWDYSFDPNGAWNNLSAFQGLSAYVAALPATGVPDDATLLSSYDDPNTVSSSDPRLQVIGRRDAGFAVLRVQNTTGTWAAILRDGQTPMPLTGMVTVHGMAANAGFTVRWFDTGSGSVLATQDVQAADNGDLTLALPQLVSESVAALVTCGKAAGANCV